MAGMKDKTPPLVRLGFDKGELIMKEGDYGLSIYKILKGHVRVFKKKDDTEIPLATLGAGEIFGEMTFLTKLMEARSASVLAVDQVELEVWHPARLSKEYDQMPSILKYIISQTLDRLTRMNKIISNLSDKKNKLKEKKAPKEHGASQRKYFRKDFNKTCIYRPKGSSGKVRLNGRVTDISVGGASINISAKNALNFTHDKGDNIEIETILPSGQKIYLSGKIMTIKKDKVPGRMNIGLKFGELTGDASKKLGFYLMS